jgi:enterochelin esterase-like enzyme
MKFPVAFFAFALAAATALAVDPPPPPAPIVSPEVHANNSVTFRFRAPDAKEVVLQTEALPKPQPMVKDADGVWSATTPPLAPDIYVYSFHVNGQLVLDPANPFIKYNLFNTENQVHVPGPKDLPWEINDVPHGVLHQHHYRSAIIGDERDVWIYTPPGYDPAARKSYPVLYLLHGFSDAEDAWVSVGRANIILDNLIARGAAKPMLVVMPRGYGNREVTASGWTLVRSTAFRDIWNDSNAKYQDSLLHEIIPLVEQNYRVTPGAAARAIAGLSMGGSQSLRIGLNSPERFGWVGSFSGAIREWDYDTTFAGVNDRLNRDLRLLWIGCGTEDGLIASNRQMHAWLNGRGVRHTFVETPGARHSFLLWRRYFAQFAALVFQDSP